MEEKIKTFSIASGSKGNATFIKFKNTSILIDCGVSFEKIKKALQKNGEDVLNLNAILLTHEHSDHTAGLAVLVKHMPNIKIFAHSQVCVVLGHKIPTIKNNLISIDLPIFYLDDLMVCAFLVPHDSVACFGYSILAEGKKISITTDIGKIDGDIIQSIYDSDIIFLESNHSPKLLKECEKYSAVLKQRILSQGGHLSNQKCAQALCEIFSLREKERLSEPQIVLCHLSQNTNSVEVASAEIFEVLKASNIDCGFIFASQENGTGVMYV